MFSVIFKLCFNVDFVQLNHKENYLSEEVFFFVVRNKVFL